MAPMEPWEKVLVSTNYLENDVHGQVACVNCHGGNNEAETKEEAHVNMQAKPDENPVALCGNCHNEIATTAMNSLHFTQEGYEKAIFSRSIPENHPALEEMFDNHCASCHTTCGDCHVSQPSSVGGGLLDGHIFTKTPPMTRTCTACHGSRVGNEYMGKNEGLTADVHFREGRMNCIACHDGANMHDSEGNTDRYAGEQNPKCLDCHETIGRTNDPIIQHQIHADLLSCQTCHSIAYSSCDSCHVSISESSGNPIFKTEATYMTFFIGQNPLKSSERPYDYVPVRHVPVDPDSYAYYGEDLLPNFDLLPTWVYSTPHNIQRFTPQNMTCNSCHGNPDIFLTADKVSENELAANQEVIVDNVPDPIPNQ